MPHPDMFVRSNWSNQAQMDGKDLILITDYEQTLPFQSL